MKDDDQWAVADLFQAKPLFIRSWLKSGIYVLTMVGCTIEFLVASRVYIVNIAMLKEIERLRLYLL